MKAIDLVGRVFGRLQVVARAGSTDRTPPPPKRRLNVLGAGDQRREFEPNRAQPRQELAIQHLAAVDAR